MLTRCVAGLVLVLCCAGLGSAAEDIGVQSTVDDMLLRGRELYAQSKLEDAQQQFEEVLKLDSENEVAVHYLARINARRGLFKPAIDLIRRLQSLGVSIYRSEDSRRTLDVVIAGILGMEDLRKRADMLIHLRETVQGLPIQLERRIDAHLMGIYAKLGERQLHEIIRKRYFANKPVPSQAYFVAARTYLHYNVELHEAANYFEQAIELMRKRRPRQTGNPAYDAYLAKVVEVEPTIAEDFLAYTYHACGILDPERNRFVAAEPNPKTTFRDVTEEAGLAKVAGSRVAVGDFDNDGLEDLCVMGKIYRNVDGKRFTDVTEKTGINPEKTLSALWLDYDADGNLDLLLASYPKVHLWRNRGDGTFEETTSRAGLDYAFPGTPETLSACDYDCDGRLDIFIGCFEHPRQPGAGQPDFLFHNEGNGRFLDQSAAAGITTVQFCTRACAWADFDNNGRPDLYVANYRLHPNQLWANKGRAFADEAQALGVWGIPGVGRYAMAFGRSMACAWGDIDNDGDLDLAVTNLALVRDLYYADPTTIYLNRGEKERWRFANITDQTGIRFQEMATDISFADFDNDTDLDLLLSAMYKERPIALYQNIGNNKFQQVTWRSGAIVFNTTSHAWFDKDNDGDLDLVLTGPNGLHLLENQLSGSSWLRVKLEGRANNHRGIGARVTVVAGPLTLIREIPSARGSTSQDSPIAHFGLGSHRGTVAITVRWPTGKTQTVTTDRVNKLVKIVEEAEAK